MKPIRFHVLVITQVVSTTPVCFVLYLGLKLQLSFFERVLTNEGNRKSDHQFAIFLQISTYDLSVHLRALLIVPLPFFF